MEEKYNVWITALKGATYAAITSAATMGIQLAQEGINLQEALITGISVGLVAGLKNFVKFKYNIDLDFSKIQK